MAGILRPFLDNRTYVSSPPSLEEQLEADNSTFLVGAVLVYNSGVLQEGGVDPVNIAGVAIINGQNGVAKTTTFSPPLPHSVYSGQIDDGTLNGSYAIANGDLGAQYGITKEAASGNWYVDKSKTGASARVTIVSLGGAVGGKNGRVHFTFKQSATLYS